MDAETRRRAVFELALEYANLREKAKDIGIIDITYRGWLQMDSKEFLESFGTVCKVKRRDSELFPYEAYSDYYNGTFFAVLTEEQYEILGVAADE